MRALAADCELMLVVGSPNSSNSRRLVEVAERAGCRGLLIGGAAEIPPAALIGVRRDRPHRRGVGPGGNWWRESSTPWKDWALLT